MIENPYLVLHREFKEAGADLLISSGQACVLFGIAAFSKDGDWIIREEKASCSAVLDVLARKGANYRLGMPLALSWLEQGWTSHFEYQDKQGYRMRVDICSRPPRVPRLDRMWTNVVRIHGVDVIDVETLILIKQTRRIRDYSIIGALAEVVGFNEGIAEIALDFLQDYDLLKEAVSRWPDRAKQSRREAVGLLCEGAARREVVTALALEQDENIRADQKRINGMRATMERYQRQFIKLRAEWRDGNVSLDSQHQQLIHVAARYISREQDND